MSQSQLARQLDEDFNLLTADSLAVHPANPQPKRVRRIKIKYGTLLCSVLLLCLVVNVVGLHWEIIQLNQEINVKTQEKQQLLAYQEELQEDMKMVQSGNYIEKLAREKLGMIKPGENPVITTNPGDIRN